MSCNIFLTIDLLYTCTYQYRFISLSGSIAGTLPQDVPKAYRNVLSQLLRASSYTVGLMKKINRIFNGTFQQSEISSVGGGGGGVGFST